MPTIPIELAGDWRGSSPEDASAVLTRMRMACLGDIPMRSDRQPARLRVDDHLAGPPHIWLQARDPTTAWIVVDVGSRDWCKLCYQFGHELGHVVANSWTPDAKPRNPSQWLEEGLVEAFSLRGLGRLATEWERSPPFPNDGAYGDAIRSYRLQVLTPYRQIAQEEGASTEFAAWYATRTEHLNAFGGLDAARGAVPTLLGLLERQPNFIQDIGAMNRWPERTGIPVFDYLGRWAESCIELGTAGALPRLLTEMLFRR